MVVKPPVGVKFQYLFRSNRDTIDHNPAGPNHPRDLHRRILGSSRIQRIAIPSQAYVLQDTHGCQAGDLIILEWQGQN